MMARKPIFERDVFLDYWSTSMHGDQIGIYGHEPEQASMRTLTKDFNICGEVLDGDRKGVYGYRRDAWEPDTRDPLEYYTRKRLVLRWFDRGYGDKLEPVGALEEMTLDSIRKTMIADDPLHSFKVIIDEYQHVILLTKEHARLPGRMGEMWGFAVTTDPYDKEWEVFLLDERRFTIGTDFDAKKDELKDVLVRLDERVFSLGKKIKITFYNKRLYECKTFYRTIILFAMMFHFKKELRHKIQRARELISSSGKTFSIDPNEALFNKNPRFVKS